MNKLSLKHSASIYSNSKCNIEIITWIKSSSMVETVRLSIHWYRAFRTRPEKTTDENPMILKIILAESFRHMLATFNLIRYSYHYYLSELFIYFFQPDIKVYYFGGYPRSTLSTVHFTAGMSSLFILKNVLIMTMVKNSKEIFKFRIFWCSYKFGLINIVEKSFPGWKKI